MPDENVSRVKGRAEKVVEVTLDEVRQAFDKAHDLVERFGASAHLTAAKDRLKDAVQFVRAHVDAK